MNSSIPLAAAHLLSFISLTETGKPSPDCYEVIFANKQRYLKKPLTQMTLDEVEADSPRRTKAYGSSAAGAYQFMRDTLDKPGTLADLEGEMGLTGKELMSADLQDLMGYHLLKRRGYAQFMTGKIDGVEFAKRLAQEWASFPVLVACQGAHRKLKRGQSYYAGDGLNKALVKPEQVETVLHEMLVIGAGDQKFPETAPRPGPAPVDVPVVETLPVPSGSSGSGFMAVFLIVGSALALAWQWIASLPCNVLGLFCGS